MTVFVAVIQVCDREGRARHARQALRPPGLSRHGGALDEAARLLPEAETDQQPPGPVRTRRCLGLSSILFDLMPKNALLHWPNPGCRFFVLLCSSVALQPGGLAFVDLYRPLTSFKTQGLFSTDIKCRFPFLILLQFVLHLHENRPKNFYIINMLKVAVLYNVS